MNSKDGEGTLRREGNFDYFKEGISAHVDEGARSPYLCTLETSNGKVVAPGQKDLTLQKDFVYSYKIVLIS